MNHEPDPQLEELIARRLRQLPERSAPATLIPRVLAALEAQRLPWWQRAWPAWPRPAQAAALLLALLVAALMTYGSWSATDRFEPRWLEVGDHFAPVSWLGETVASLANALAVLLRSSQSWLLYGVVPLAAMYAICLALGRPRFRLLPAKR